MNSRRQARFWAIQVLYQRSLNSEGALDAALQEFWDGQETVDDNVKGFSESLIRGTLAHLGQLDKAVSGYAKNWNIDRIGKIDLAILRLALFEILYRDDIPPVASVNEALELSKLFSTEETVKFVNGILDRALQDLKRPLRSAADKEES